MSPTTGKSESVVGVSIVLEAYLIGFTGEKLYHKTAALLTSSTPLPATKKGILFKDRSVPINGQIALKLYMRGAAIVTLLEIQEDLPVRRLDRHIGSVWNWSQKLIRHVPVVGKALEGIVPDARQFNRVTYDISVSVGRTLEYTIDVFDSARTTPVLSYTDSHKI